MYIQITERCNMECEHCCSSCGPKTGIHMPMAVFKKALDFCAENGDSPFIGGGEPTVHPKFWEFIGLVLGRAHELDTEYISLITNGKKTEDALALANLAKRGVLGVGLSQDEFHEEIDERVVEAFTVDKGYPSIYSNDRDHDHRWIHGDNGRGYRTVYPTGRGKDCATEEGCVCEDLQVDPHGRIWACGCKTKQFGTLDNPDIPADYQHECWETMKERREEEREVACA